VKALRCHAGHGLKAQENDSNQMNGAADTCSFLNIWLLIMNSLKITILTVGFRKEEMNYVRCRTSEWNITTVCAGYKNSFTEWGKGGS
jgi:hypothetical protein